MKVRGKSLRLVSGIFLCMALAMLVLGLTLFSNQLQKSAFVIYWVTCFLLTGITAIFALIDLALLRREQRQEQRDLIAQTLQEAKEERSRKCIPKK